MRALVVFESMFGNTQKVAEAIADGLSITMTADIVEVGSAGTSLEGIDLLVAGGPTHAFGMSRVSTRESAAGQAAGGVVSKSTGLREWLSEVRADGAVVATFDTKAIKPRLPGSAAHAARRMLRRRGFRPVAAPASFYVTGTTGPLAEGEEDRARAWGEQLGLAVT
ncbi:flavodoxin family protein [Jiangella endophytica]|uniref:flavodoxin family protein n=1 Tax=Jiangella endophytica TaxID=1623398 RepID=UPI000E34E165|nr:flavodoxin domain-containing protein [Jiangella endophytica]